MAIIRACSYNCTITLPENASEYSKILVTFSQGKTKLIDKDETELQLSGRNVEVHLTQEETKLFKAPSEALLQVRCFKSIYNAPGSRIWVVDVYPALNDEVLS